MSWKDVATGFFFGCLMCYLFPRLTFLLVAVVYAAYILGCYKERHRG